MPLIADPVARELAAVVADLRADVDQLQADGRATQLGYSALEPGKPLLVTNGGGAVVAAIGAGAEAFTIKIMNGPPPSRPAQAELTPILGGVRVRFSGNHVDGMPEDYDYSKVYWSTDPLFEPPEAGNYAGQLFGDDSLPISVEGGTTIYVRIISVNTSGKESEPSLPVSATAGQVVAQSVIDGIVGTLALANGAVVEAKLAGGAVTNTKIADDSISSPKIIAGGVQTVNLAADSVAAGKIAADAITAREIQALSITAAEIAANAITATKIAAGSITANHLTTDFLLANTRIVVGSLSGGRVQLHHTQGLELYAPNGTTRTGWWDPATGNVWTQGQFSTAGSGTRIVINPATTAPDEIRFYQGSVYAYLNAEPAPGGTAALIGRSQASSNSRGSFGCYPGEGFVSLTNAAGTLSETAFSAIKGTANVWGGQIVLEGREQYGSGQIVLGVRNSSNTWQGSREMRLIDQGANDEPAWWASGQNVKLVFSNGALFVQNNASDLAPIAASAFNGPSSQTIKKRVRRARLSKKSTFGDAAVAVEPMAWLYEHEYEEGEAAPDLPPVVTRVPRRRDDGRQAYDKYTNEPIFDEVVTAPTPIRRTKPHMFPVAEDLEAVLPELVTDDPMAPGGKTVDLRDFAGYLYGLCREQELTIRELQRRISEMDGGRLALSATLQVPVGDPLGPSTRGQLFERNGALWYMNTHGISKKVG